MTRKKKYISVVVLTGLMCSLILTGCGDKDKEEKIESKSVQLRRR